MIAGDTSSLIAYFEGATGRDVDLIEEALGGKHLVISPVVQTELMSIPDLPKEMATAISLLPLIGIKTGYWKRAGEARAKLIGKGYKARVADALVAQSCLDAEIVLITRDKDFKPFSEYCALKLA